VEKLFAEFLHRQLCDFMS